MKGILKKSVRICLFCGFLFVAMGMTGCTPKKVSFVGELGSGICYHDTIYWETGTQTDVTDIRKVGEIRNVEEEGTFPRTPFSATSPLKQDAGKDVYAGDGNLYVKDQDYYRVFQIIEEMDLGEEIPESPYPGQDVSYAPHFVVNGMRYWMIPEPLSVNTIPESFSESGEINKDVFYAARNNTGFIPVGTKWFASDFQNRYVIVQYPDDTLDVYENEMYQQKDQ